MTSSTRPLPPAEARKGWTTARTTEPTVEPSSRAGMHTETVRPARGLGLEAPWLGGEIARGDTCARHAPDSEQPRPTLGRAAPERATMVGIIQSD